MSNLIWVVIVVLLVFAIVGAPGVGVWQHNFGYAPSGAVVVVVAILLILLLTGRL